MTDVASLYAELQNRFSSKVARFVLAFDEITLELSAQHLREVCLALRDEPAFDFKMLIDVCGVDYLDYGLSQWETETATATGFERGTVPMQAEPNNPKYTGPRFASVYHLLSLTQNHRVRLKVFLEEHRLQVPSVVDIWPAANWFEREAFDLFGIIYDNHPDLRRLLTDYGFVGHPFRKDFPLIGNVEARYDAKEKRVIYEPVSIQPRILEPKVIRTDNRYKVGE